MLVRMLDPDLVLDAAARERLVDRFGPGTQQWCDELPGLVSRCMRRWGLELDQALSGGTSRVYLGRQRGARGVVLKLTPDSKVAETEALALEAWAGTKHAVDMLDADLDANALLLEKLEPGTKLSAQPELPPFAVIGELVGGLRAQVRDGHFPTLAQRMDFLFGLIGRRRGHPRVSALVTPEMVTRARRLALDLAAAAADAGRTSLLHGDLHAGNVLIAERGLVAIDPRPCTGDPASDVIDWAMGRAATTGELDDRIRKLCDHIPGLSPGSLWQWCRATAVIGAVQTLYRRPPDPATRLMLVLAATV